MSIFYTQTRTFYSVLAVCTRIEIKMVYYDRNESLSFKKCYLRSFLVVDNIQNPKLDDFRVLYYIFFRLTKHDQMTKM